MNIKAVRRRWPETPRAVDVYSAVFTGNNTSTKEPNAIAHVNVTVYIPP
jgi:hypothetical protein